MAAPTIDAGSGSAPVVWRHVEHVMGMPVSFAAREPVPAMVLSEAVALLHEADATFSTYRADSEINRIDRNELAVADASPEVWEVLEACEALRVDTDGWFDAWAVPRRQPARLDPSGYVKGWAVRRAAACFDGAGLTDYSINAGGDVVVRCPPERAPWRIGVRHPFDPASVAVVIEANRLAVATSGAYERGEHIHNPHSGEVPAGLASLTVVGDDLALVDAYATAAFAMGAEGPAWVARQEGLGVFAVTTEGTTLSDAVFDSHRPIAA